MVGESPPPRTGRAGAAVLGAITIALVVPRVPQVPIKVFIRTNDGIWLRALGKPLENRSVRT
jgi:hypothetical protein